MTNHPTRNWRKNWRYLDINTVIHRSGLTVNIEIEPNVKSDIRTIGGSFPTPMPNLNEAEFLEWRNQTRMLMDQAFVLLTKAISHESIQ